MREIPQLVPFEPWHVTRFFHRDPDFFESFKVALQKAHNGPAFTGIYDGMILGCSGMEIPWPGFGLAWGTYTEDLFKNHKIWAHRITRRVLRDCVRIYHLRRVEMVVLSESERNVRWAESLGFKREEGGMAQHYTANGDNVYRYEWIIKRTD